MRSSAAFLFFSLFYLFQLVLSFSLVQILVQMKSVLSHRHSFPFLTLAPSLTSTASAMRPAVLHKEAVSSSLFPEIEQLEPSFSSLASIQPEQPMDDDDDDDGNTQQRGVFQELKPDYIEPFISPLTESNLKYHTGSVSLCATLGSREARGSSKRTRLIYAANKTVVSASKGNSPAIRAILHPLAGIHAKA